MEHETLKNKLESLDLGKVPDLQWDQERTWSRLNAQLESTTIKKTPMWRYGIAATILLLITSGLGYLIIDSSFSSQQTIALNNNVDNKSSEVNDVSTTLIAEPCEEVEIDEQQTLNVVTKEATLTPVANQTIAIKSEVVKESEVKKAQVESKEIIIPEETELLATNEIEIIQEIVENDATEATIEEQNDVVPETVMTSLSSKPLPKHKKRFSIKLFQKKNKQTARNVDKVPALTLFTHH